MSSQKKNSERLQECCEQYWTNPGGNILQDTN